MSRDPMQKISNHIIRPVTLQDVPAIAAVHVEAWQSSYKEILPADFLAGLSVERRTQEWSQSLTEPRRIVLAATTPDDRIVGFCVAGPNREEPKTFQGEVYAIYLLDEAKRKGAGRALFIEAAASLAQNEMCSLLVWVLSANAVARKFYEALGGEFLCEKPLTIAGLPYVEVAYGWREGLKMPSSG